jgi:large subunit ribosomal protein L23
MKNYDIIKAPIITEKTAQQMQEENKFTFEVAATANKTQIKQAVEAIFEVKVDKVNVVNVKPKTKRVGRYVGKTNRVRKAVITLAEGSTIGIFE